MASVGSLTVNLRTNSSSFITGMKKSQNAVSRFGKTARGITSAIGGVSVAFGTAGLVGALAGSVRAAKKQEDAERKLAAVLKTTGNAAGFTTNQLKKYASQLQSVSNFGDEVTLDMLAMLATFKEIKGDQFKEATVAIQDMATVMGTDLKSSVVQIGKALNDPILGLTALTRVGVMFTQQQKDQIRVMQEAGDIAGAQTIILKELQSEFGGAAEALADPMIQLRNSLGDVSEVLGSAALPHIREFSTWMKTLADNTTAAADAQDKFNSRGQDTGRGAFGDFVDEFVTGVKDIAAVGEAVSSPIDTAANFFESIANPGQLTSLQKELVARFTTDLTETEKAIVALREKTKEQGKQDARARALAAIPDPAAIALAQKNADKITARNTTTPEKITEDLLAARGAAEDAFDRDLITGKTFDREMQRILGEFEKLAEAARGARLGLSEAAEASKATAQSLLQAADAPKTDAERRARDSAAAAEALARGQISNAENDRIQAFMSGQDRLGQDRFALAPAAIEGSREAFALLQGAQNPLVRINGQIAANTKDTNRKLDKLTPVTTVEIA